MNLNKAFPRLQNLLFRIFDYELYELLEYLFDREWDKSRCEVLE